MEPQHVGAIFSGDYESDGEMVNYMLSDSPGSIDKLIDFTDVASNRRGYYCDGHDHDDARMELGENLGKIPVSCDKSGRRKRPRSTKTSEQVEIQRMTHIAVERNRRRQMNEHLHVLKTLMPTSYVRRGDQASIIGGAIEFVRELEQLVQCLESRKRRRAHVDIDDNRTKEQLTIVNDRTELADYDANGLPKENAKVESCLADVEVRVLGFDGLIKILSRTKPGQLVKTIAGLEDLQINIVHANVTTIEQNVLYSFRVKMDGDSFRFTAEDIANSIQKILSNFTDAGSNIYC